MMECSNMPRKAQQKQQKPNSKNENDEITRDRWLSLPTPHGRIAVAVASAAFSLSTETSFPVSFAVF